MATNKAPMLVFHRIIVNDIRIDNIPQGEIIVDVV